MAKTFWYEIDVQGAGRIREEIRADRHEQAEAIFKSRWGFSPRNESSKGRSMGYSLGGYGEVIENDTISNFENNPPEHANIDHEINNIDIVGSLGFFPTVILGGGALALMSFFGGNVTQLKEMIPNTERMEYTQQNNTPTSNPFDNVTTYSNHHIDESIPEFFNTELQEEPVNDLGQDWDN